VLTQDYVRSADTTELDRVLLRENNEGEYAGTRRKRLAGCAPGVS
jgi:isocitrate/isopropylmalate dehydrogenase